MPQPRRIRPLSVLFLCGFNALRSPLAAALFHEAVGQSGYVRSAGVRKGDLDPFAVAVAGEVGLDIAEHLPMTFEELQIDEGLGFDVIITLSPEAHHRALELTRTLAVEVEYWPTNDPTAVDGTREQRLNAYREVRDQLTRRITLRFGATDAPSE